MYLLVSVPVPVLAQEHMRAHAYVLQVHGHVFRALLDLVEPDSLFLLARVHVQDHAKKRADVLVRHGPAQVALCDILEYALLPPLVPMREPDHIQLCAYVLLVKYAVHLALRNVVQSANLTLLVCVWVCALEDEPLAGLLRQPGRLQDHTRAHAQEVHALGWLVLAVYHEPIPEPVLVDIPEPGPGHVIEPELVLVRVPERVLACGRELVQTVVHGIELVPGRLRVLEPELELVRVLGPVLESGSSYQDPKKEDLRARNTSFHSCLLRLVHVVDLVLRLVHVLDLVLRPAPVFRRQC